VLTRGTGVGEYRVEAVHIEEAESGQVTQSVATIAGVAEPDVDAETSVELKETGEVVVDDQDITPPVTTVTLAGTIGASGWYTSDVTVTLTATDPDGGSGVEQTEYSLDNGVTWNTYMAPITIVTEGTTTLQYFSTDKAGNQEVKKTETIRIDKVAPEGKIAFNPTTQKLDITGTDNLGGPVTVIMVEQKKDLVAANTKLKKIKPWFERWLKRHKKNLPDMLATLTDEAGHTTSISFEKTRDRQGYVFVRVRSLGYDDSETVPTEAQAQYKWRVDRKNQYQQLASQIRVDAQRLESHYIPKKNETWIMERPQDLGDDERDDESERRPVRQKLPGMVVLYLQTGQGKIEIKY
nr:chitobiase/beta-hexosaminidase C-terminal domain-containing protein [Candidatus Moranbacteria bacterium]